MRYRSKTFVIAETKGNMRRVKKIKRHRSKFSKLSTHKEHNEFLVCYNLQYTEYIVHVTRNRSRGTMEFSKKTALQTQFKLKPEIIRIHSAQSTCSTLYSLHCIDEMARVHLALSVCDELKNKFLLRLGRCSWTAIA